MNRRTFLKFTFAACLSIPLAKVDNLLIESAFVEQEKPQEKREAKTFLMSINPNTGMKVYVDFLNPSPGRSTFVFYSKKEILFTEDSFVHIKTIDEGKFLELLRMNILDGVL